jgi:hypothetical protein
VTRVAFLLAPRLHLLDLAGPAQAFSTAADLGAGYVLHYVACHRYGTGALPRPSPSVLASRTDGGVGAGQWGVEGGLVYDLSPWSPLT